MKNVNWNPLRPEAFAVVALTLGLASMQAVEVDRSAIEYAATPEAKGLAIAVAADKRDEGWQDWTGNAEMVLKNRHGETSSRAMRMKALEQIEDGDKRVIVFDEPRDVKGTAFLVHSKKVGNDDQWLFLPALKRVKRISANNKSGPFVGSEFAYEDLSSQEPEKYTYQFLRDETFDGMDTWVVERYPVDEKSGYTKQIVWIDQAEFRVLKTDYYDRKESLLKTFLATGYQKYAGDYWRADKMAMENHQTGKSTDLNWTNYEFGTGLQEREFHRNNLENVR